MIILFSSVLTIASVLMIVLILMHKGRGGGLSDMFGGGMSSSLGGSSVAERNLDRITVGVAVTYGQTRFRTAAEPSLAVLAAVALVAAWGEVRAWRARSVQSRGAPARSH